MTTQPLSNSLEEFLSLNFSSNSLLLTKEVLKLLSTKDLIITHNKSEVESWLTEIGWNGSLNYLGCGDKCYLDEAGVFESALSSGSTNINRETITGVSIEANLIKRELTHFLENNNREKYRAYIRFILNSDSGLSPVKLASKNEEVTNEFEVRGERGYKEAGVFVEINPGETLAIVFSWESGIVNLNDLNSYKFKFVKQPGVNNHSLEVQIKKTDKYKILSKTEPSLTNSSLFIYNTKLAQDYLINLELNK